MPLAENADWSNKFGDMGKLTGLIEGGVVLRDNGDRPDFAFLLPLAHQVLPHEAVGDRRQEGGEHEGPEGDRGDQSGLEAETADTGSPGPGAARHAAYPCSL